jgi:hypothetical protein
MVCDICGTNTTVMVTEEKDQGQDKIKGEEADATS